MNSTTVAVLHGLGLEGITQVEWVVPVVAESAVFVFLLVKSR